MKYLESDYQQVDPAQWEQHIAEPFSPASLGAPNKPYMIVQGLSFPDSLCEFDEPGQDWAVNDGGFKYADEGEFSLACVSNVCSKRRKGRDCDAPDGASDLHIAFEETAQHILGKTAFAEHTVELKLWRSAVQAGTGQETDWHLDSSGDLEDESHGYSDGERLMGIMSDVLPTQVLLNPTRPDDYEDGYLKSVEGIPLDKATLHVRTLPPNTLTVIPMNMPHRGQVAKRNMPRRHFGRWTVLH